MVGFRTWALIGVLLALRGPAAAAEKPDIGPPEAWIAAAPQTPQPMKAAEGAAVANLMQDAQLRVGAEGADLYQAGKLKVQTAQGLQALATFGLSWSPETDNLVVHHLQILRGDQVIDLLPKDGIFTIARREEKLDSEGRLDGVLTAIVKLDGLKIGDILDVAYTLHHHDPLFKDRVDQLFDVPDVLPITYQRIRVRWPRSAQAQWKVSGGLPEPHVIDEDGVTEADIILNGVTPLIKPQGAPARFQRGREFSISNYRDWAAVSAALAPMFTAATQLEPHSPLEVEAANISARTTDPKLRAGAALALTEDNIRYLAQTLGEGGYQPATADDTWRRRYGDCKAKTVMLLALLNKLGVEAEPVLVSTVFGKDLDTRLPSLAVFDHVLVRAIIDGRDYWLDGTRAGDLSVATLSTPDYGDVLPVRAAGATLLRLVPEPLTEPQTSNVIRLDASKGLSAPAAAHVETVWRGDAAAAMRVVMAALAPADQDRAMRNYWHQTYDDITVVTSKAVFDPASGEERLIMDGEAKLDWTGGYEPDGAELGWKFDTTRDPAAIHPDAPFTVNYPFYEVHDVAIVLPDHGEGFRVWGDNVDRQLAGYALTRQTSITDGVFHMRTATRSLTPEISRAQAEADAGPLETLSKTTLRIVPPATASANVDMKALMSQEPTDAAGYIARGLILNGQERSEEALHDFNRAVQLDQNSATALAGRAVVEAKLLHTKEALADADAAEQIDPRQPNIYRARGYVAQWKNDWPGTIENYTRVIDLDPDTFSYDRRALAYQMTKDYVRSIRDSEAELKLNPTDFNEHFEMAMTYDAMNQPDKARAEYDNALSLAPDASWIREMRLRFLIRRGDLKTARTEVDAAIKANPTAANYLQRIIVRDAHDQAGREADALAAHAADPTNFQALENLISYRLLAKDYVRALEWADKAVAAAPIYNVNDVRVERADIYVKLGRLEAARAEFQAVRDQATSPAADDYWHSAHADMLNEICFHQATANLDLVKALADCDTSLTLESSADTLDSRGFVLLRLGRNNEAKTMFDQALAMKPDLATSLYGRALLERRLGDAVAADKDRLAALASDPKVVEIFAGYGVTQ